MTEMRTHAQRQKEWRRLLKIYEGNLLSLIEHANGYHMDRREGSICMINHPPTGDLLEAKRLIKEAVKLMAAHPSRYFDEC